MEAGCHVLLGGEGRNKRIHHPLPRVAQAEGDTLQRRRRRRGLRLCRAAACPAKSSATNTPTPAVAAVRTRRSEGATKPAWRNRTRDRFNMLRPRASSAFACWFLFWVLLGEGGGPMMSGAWANASGTVRRSNAVALFRLGTTALSGGISGGGEIGARRAGAVSAASRRPTELGGNPIHARNSGEGLWGEWERAVQAGIDTSSGKRKLGRETSSPDRPSSLPPSSNLGRLSKSSVENLPESSCRGKLEAEEEGEEGGGAVSPPAIVDPTNPFSGDLPLVREQLLKIEVAETGAAAVAAATEAEVAASPASLHVRKNAFARAAPADKPGAGAKNSSSSRSSSSRSSSSSNNNNNNNNNSRSSDRTEKKDEPARMRRYLPGAKSTGQYPFGVASPGRGGGAPPPTPPGRKKGPLNQVEATGEQIVSEAEHRARLEESTSPRESADEKSASGGGKHADGTTSSTQRQRKCPPAVGFVGGFRDIPVGACGPSSPYGTRVFKTEALIQALTEPLKPSPRGLADLLAERQRGGRAYVSDGGRVFPMTSGHWPTTAGREVSSSRSKEGLQQKKKKSCSSITRLIEKDSLSSMALDDRSKEMEPPNRCIAITFDPAAPTLLGCITTSTDVYGPALCSDAAANLSREETAAYLERWVLVAVKHGVLPRELRALLQDEEGHDGLQLDTPSYYSRGEEGREAGSGGVFREEENRYRAGGRSDGGEGLSSSGHGAGVGCDGGGDSGATSWTKYGWNRFDVAAPSAVGAGDGSALGDEQMQRQQLAMGDEEVKEEEEMENVAEALVGGRQQGEAAGGNDPPSPTSRSSSLPPSSEAALRPEWRYRHPDPDANPPGSSAARGERGRRRRNERRGGVADSGQKSSLGWRVLEVVEARFKSGLHPPRIIVIGDVHGCVNEMKDLVRKVEYWPGDLLLFLGDLVAKGPNSAGVVRTARELGGVSVRGNHEFEVLRWLNVGENMNGTGPTPHHQIALSLGEDDGVWLKNCPWYFQCEELDALFVHAGFTPGVKLRRQNPRMMMNMRSLTIDGGLPTSKVVENRPWAREWAGPDTVFFGHDAARGLQVLDQAMGLDTGCVYGGRLTACILPERRLVSVASKAAYIQYQKRRRRSFRGGGGDGGSGSGRDSGSGEREGRNGASSSGSGGSNMGGKSDGRHRSPYDKLSPG